MGRTEPSYAPMAQQSFRKDQRAKTARNTINKTIPQILASDARARKGIENAYLFTHATFGADSAKQRGSQKSNSKGQRSGKGKSTQTPDSTVDEKQSKGSDDALEADIKPCEISIRVTDTITAAHSLHKAKRSKKNVAILNMASPLRPGGGVLNGATSQEESICARTTLLPSLKEEWYRLPDVGGIWSPDVLVFRLPGTNDDEDIPKAERFYVDVVSAAMTRFPDVVERSTVRSGDEEHASDDEELELEKVYVNQKDRDLALEKMRAVMQVLKSQKTEYVVLGAWGCGAYGNPTMEICRAWKKALLGTRSSGTAKSQATNLGSIKEIIFAIKDAHMAHAFAKHWGDGMEVTIPEKPAREAPDVALDEQQAEELRLKIEALELQIEQAKTPLLKQGLQSTRQVLKLQLDQLGQQSSSKESVDSEDEI